MSNLSLQQTAIALLKRRESPASPWYYLQANWKSWLGYKLLYLAIIAACFTLAEKWIAISFACYILGAVLRDIRWWFTLAKQWPNSVELLDWQKIEKLAGETSKVQ